MGRRGSLIPTTSQMSCKDVAFYPNLAKAFLDDLRREHRDPPPDVMPSRSDARPFRDSAPDRSSGMSSPAGWD